MSPLDPDHESPARPEDQPAQPPAPLEYASPPPRREPADLTTYAFFFAGLALGVTVSALVWPLGWKYVDGEGGWLLWFVPVTKLVLAILVIRSRRWRGLGPGLIVSVPLGFLVFFVTCAANFKI